MTAARRRVHVTGAVPKRVADALEQDFELVSDPAAAEGILALITTTVDDAYLERAGPQLQVVANYGVGVNNIDLGAAQRRGVLIANTPDVLTKTTAELAIAVTLALLRRVVEGDRFVRSRSAWSFSLEFMLGEGLDGRRSASSAPAGSARRRRASRKPSARRRSSPAGTILWPSCWRAPTSSASTSHSPRTRAT